MSSQIKTINLGGVNCYLASSPDSFVLIDTGFSGKRALLLKELESAGCAPGKLRLILITHGDADHAGNAAYLREKFGAKIAMHADDAGMVERGDMGWNRKAKPDKMSLIMKVMASVMNKFVKSGVFQKFTPDMTVDDGFDLSAYGLDAAVLHLPGHSKGSIGILTKDGDLFCGDLFYNMPGFKFVDNLKDHDDSVKKLKGLNVHTIYPGHGKALREGYLQKQ
ncbi:MAG: MBL fold metallo-hydrolase [Spirochaetia bacterium]|jgi:glyoxylase-like metal-dependent hydrolase (beta-lactamase superfamily II)